MRIGGHRVHWQVLQLSTERASSLYDFGVSILFLRLRVKIATSLSGSSQEAPHDSKLGQKVIEYD